MLIIIQIIFVLFALLAISRVILKFRQKAIKFQELIFWLFVWLILGAVVLSPSLAQKIANRVGIGRGADLIIYTSIAVIFYILFRLVVKLSRIEKEITKIVREIALREKNKSEN